MKLWQKRYILNEKIEKFTVGNDHILDQKLVKYDCTASIAHAKMLKKIGILTSAECDKIIMILYKTITLNENKSFLIDQQDEDCHTAIENYLVKKLGDVGKKIHTARSRNDQVLTALRLYYKDEMKTIVKLVDTLVDKLNNFKDKYESVKIPGYTHMQKAMPSSVGLWAYAFVESMNDNKKLLQDISQLIDQSPLGTGAGYGLPIDVDRELTAKLLSFSKVQKNPIYVQNSRGKFESTILHGLNQIMIDLNKMSSDIMLFSMSEIGYMKLPSEICTGSSIMPHKKNPDVLELVRANYHKTISFEFEIKSIISNLVSGYNRDLQLTKEPTIKAFEITKESLEAMKIVLDQIKVDEDKCKKGMVDELYATDEVYDLVKRGIPFREAYKEITNLY
ncbi:MAG: argininosuccinate lyase [Thermoplasmatales archaeon]|nr:MAG: argininosuccinate lyase [Thermoplasmatales archaeon]